MSIDHSAPRRMHDLGGTEQVPFAITEHEPSDFDRRVDALVNLLAHAEVGVVCPDERRRGIEELSLEQYQSLTYYQRWLTGVVNILMEKRILTPEEIAQRVARIKEQLGCTDAEHG